MQKTLNEQKGEIEKERLSWNRRGRNVNLFTQLQGNNLIFWQMGSKIIQIANTSLKRKKER